MPAKRSPALFELVLKAIARLESNFDRANKRKIMSEVVSGLDQKCKPVPDECTLRTRINAAICYGVEQGVLSENSGRVRLKVGPLAILKNDQKERRFTGDFDPDQDKAPGSEGPDALLDPQETPKEDRNQCSNEETDNREKKRAKHKDEHDDYHEDVDEDILDDGQREEQVYNEGQDDQDDDEEQEDRMDAQEASADKRPKLGMTLRFNRRRPEIKRLNEDIARRQNPLQPRKLNAKGKRYRRHAHKKGALAPIDDAANKRPSVLDHFRNQHYQNSSYHTVNGQQQDLNAEGGPSKPARSPKIKVVKF